MVRKGEVTEHGSIIVMDPPDHRHMRSLLNKVFTPRAIQSQQPMVSELIDKHLAAVDPSGFDFVQNFSALFPVDVITTMQGVPEQDRQRVRLWIGRRPQSRWLSITTNSSRSVAPTLAPTS
jgi:cytochrome P450